MAFIQELNFMITNVLKIDTGKFWSFKDTKNYKDLLQIVDSDVVRTFNFSKSFLLKIKNSKSKEIQYVIPICFVSFEWPRGFYVCLDKDTRFIDQDIIEMVEINESKTRKNI